MNLGAPAWRQINSGRPGLAARGQAGRGWLTMLVRGTELPRPRRPPAGISSSVGQFMVSFGEPGMPLYSLLLAPLVAVMVRADRQPSSAGPTARSWHQPETFGDDPVDHPLRQDRRHQVPHRIRRDLVAHLWAGQCQGVGDRFGDLLR